MMQISTRSAVLFTQVLGRWEIEVGRARAESILRD